MYVQHLGTSRSRSGTARLSGVNGGSAKPRDDGNLIRQWCPSPEEFDGRHENRGTPPTHPRHARAPETLLN
ncbi:hypothetical protein HY634_03305 [Candidatus Uhrbacteria bacterium]|nr:hypothetical protein [Candidatus Uhrbacteria bacterium]